MEVALPLQIKVQRYKISSLFLKREVLLDFYFPSALKSLENISLLLVNDGQDLVTMQFENILDKLSSTKLIEDILVVGIHCSTDRKNEYGTARVLDYKGRGAKAMFYNLFVMNELIPFIKKTKKVKDFKQKSFAGFSLGGLSALDIVWNFPQEFVNAGVFSGSLWWRDKDHLDEDFDENSDRIMHRLIREGNYAPWLKFFFEVGTKDETEDRNNNGIIDAIDDTLDLIKELKLKGYNPDFDIKYVELDEGKHDVPTWALAFPDFLNWAYGINQETTD